MQLGAPPVSSGFHVRADSSSSAASCGSSHSASRFVRAGLWACDPGEIVLRVSAPKAPPGGRSEDSLRLPADALPDLRDALAALDGEG